ncbi:MAG TPA: hypothetical protein VF892_08060 [Pseudonocardiaceae bacterium]
MYAAGPRTEDTERSTRDGSLRVIRSARRVFDEVSDLAFDPMLRVYLGDMVRPYGLALRDDLLDDGAGQSYGEMAEHVIRDLVSADEPVDLIVLAFGIHDIRLGRATACYLAEICPGDPMAFAVCEQGSAAAFTALRLIGEYGRSGAARRALLVVAEQSALHYQPAAPTELPERHTAVAFLCEHVPGDHRPIVVRQHADVSAQLAGALLADDVAALSAGRSDVTLVLGGGLAQIGHTYLAEHTVLAPAGRPYTGPWWELADGLDQWREAGRLVLLAEYEPTLRYLSLSAVDLGEPAAASVGLPAGGMHVPGKQWT